MHQHLHEYLTSHLKSPLAARLSGSSWAGLLGELLSLAESSSKRIKSYRKSTCSAYGQKWLHSFSRAHHGKHQALCKLEQGLPF